MTWSVLAPNRPAPSLRAPAHIVPGSPTDPPAPERCDVESARATADRFWPAWPRPVRPTGRPFAGFLRSDGHCARAPRSPHAPVRIEDGLPMATAYPSPAQSEEHTSE